MFTNMFTYFSTFMFTPMFTSMITSMITNILVEAMKHMNTFRPAYDHVDIVVYMYVFMFTSL